MKSRIWRLSVVTLVWLCAPASLFAAGAQSLESFLELKDKWSELVGSSFRIEGQYSILGKDRVKLKKCDLLFRSARPLPRLPGTSRVVELSGRLAKDPDGKLYVELDSIKELPTDLQTLQQRESTLSRSPSKEWYELAKWAAARGQFYEDEDLLKRARAINVKALNLERQELKEATPVALRRLADRVRELGLDDSQRLDLLHESLWLEWESLRKSAAPIPSDADDIDFDKDSAFAFLKRLDNDLPGAAEPQEAVLPLLANEYRKNPVLSYRSAAQTSRVALHRLFHVEVALAAVARVSKPDGSNGDVIAEQLDKLVPEQRDLAERHRLAKLTFEVKNAANLSRTQLQDLATRCRERQQEALAKEAITAWLARREKSLRKDGVTGLVQLADERLALLQDQAGAGSLLLEALQQAPTNSDVLDRLKSLGYQEVNGKWQAPQSLANAPNATPAPAVESELDRNIRMGIPSVGMTAAQLIRCLGAPSSVTRVVTSGRVTETWTYREGAAVRHTATIERRPTRGTATVIAIQ